MEEVDEAEEELDLDLLVFLALDLGCFFDLFFFKNFFEDINDPFWVTIVEPWPSGIEKDGFTFRGTDQGSSAAHDIDKNDFKGFGGVCLGSGLEACEGEG